MADNKNNQEEEVLLDVGQPFQVPKSLSKRTKRHSPGNRVLGPWWRNLGLLQLVPRTSGAQHRKRWFLRSWLLKRTHSKVP